MDVKQWLRLQWDRIAAWVCVGVGALVLLIGWLGVSRSPYPASQLPYILSGGIGGVFLLGIGAMLWLSADLRDEWTKLDHIEEAIKAGAEQGPLADPPAAGNGTGTPTRKATKARAAA